MFGHPGGFGGSTRLGGIPLNPEFLDLVQEAMEGRLPQTAQVPPVTQASQVTQVPQGEEVDNSKEEERVKLNNEKNNKKEEKEVCQGLLHGRCHFGWNGRGCFFFHL